LTTTFEAAWEHPAIRRLNLYYLVEFCGGLATIFPNTATIESDFAVLRWEKDDFRSDLSDFSL
jgi:hypothetical protein